MRPTLPACFAALVLAAGAVTLPPEAPTRPVTAREPVPLRLAAATTETPPADPCADYDALEAGRGAPERQHAFDHLDARGYARWRMACVHGWGGDQFDCLDALIVRESKWNHYARNPYSSAYGVGQALPGSKMESHGSDWRSNPRTQTRWTLDYVATRWTNPCIADAHQRRAGWY